MMVTLSYWLRLYIHYLSQYYWLTTALALPVHEFTVTPYVIYISYTTAYAQQTSVHTQTIVVGTVANLLFFAAWVLSLYCVQLASNSQRQTARLLGLDGGANHR